MVFPYSDMARRLNHRALQALPIVLVASGSMLVMVMLTASWTNFRFSAEAMTAARYNETQLGRLERLLRHTVDSEAATRGYLMSGNRAYLSLLKESEAATQPLIESLMSRVPLSDYELAELTRLKALIQRMHGIFDRSVALGQMAMADPKNGEGALKVTMDHIRSSVIQLKTDRRETNRELTEQAIERIGELRNAMIVLGIGAVALMLALFAFQQRQAVLRKRIAELLQAENAKLESMVAKRTDELSDLATYLTNTQEQERARLARELHDELGALLTAAKMDADALRITLADGAEPSVQDRFKRLIDMIGAGIRIKRRIIDDLRPPLLQGLGLVEALRALGESFATDVPTESILPDAEPTVGDDQSLALFRIAQESLTNIRKHAKAKHVQLGLAIQGHEVVLWVEDDGQGFDAKAALLCRHGLAGMRQRAHMFAGRLRLRSQPGQGTRVEARLPLAAAPVA